MFRLTLPVVVLAFALAGCAGVGPDIRTNAIVDSKTNLKGYKTYAWLGSLAHLEDPRGDWQPTGYDADSEIRFLIDQELRKRGLSFAQAAPDAYVTYLVVLNTGTGAQAQETRKHFDDEAAIRNAGMGALVIGLADPETEKVVWAGAATADVKPAKERTPDRTKERLALAVKKIFEHYPK